MESDDKNVSIEKLLGRVNLDMPLDDFLVIVAGAYSLGRIKNYIPIKVGYEELNIQFITDKGKYVVKVFWKGKHRDQISDNIKGLIKFRQKGIPVPKLLKTKGKYLYNVRTKKGNNLLCVMDFFEGKNFNKIRPTAKDLVAITNYLAKIHSLSFEVHKAYDSWGTANLLTEFNKKGKYLSKKDYDLAKPVVEKFKKIDLGDFKRCVIHGDLHREHVMKNKKGEYCILDLGCMDLNYAAIDLGIFLALFCFDRGSVKGDREKYELVVSEYLRSNSLNKFELLSLPVLIASTYASFLLSSNYESVVGGDNSAQTKNWYTFSRSGLIKMLDF